MRNGFAIAVAGRTLWGESEAGLRRGYATLFAAHGILLDADDPARLVLFPEMDATVDVPEITEACWGILGVAPESVMCAQPAHGGEAQGRRSAERRCLHAPAL